MSHNVESLRILSADAVMRRKKGLTYMKDITDQTLNSMELIGDKDIDKLLKDIDLIKERHNDDDDDVLYYLIVEHPEKGMIYGSKYGITRLFFAAKNEFLKKNTTTEFFKNLLTNVVMQNAIKSGDVEIFDYCSKYIDEEVDYTQVLKLSIMNNNVKMITYCINKDANVEKSLALENASKYGYVHLIGLFITKLRTQTNDETFNRIVEKSIEHSINKNRFEVFKLLLFYHDSIDLSFPLIYSIQLNKPQYVDYILSSFIDVLNDKYGVLLKKSLQLMNTDVFAKLLYTFTYKIETLEKLYVHISRNMNRFPELTDQYRIINQLLKKRINEYDESHK